MRKYFFTRLNNRCLILGVSGKTILLEVFSAVIFMVLFMSYFLYVIIGTLLVHFFFLALNKKGANVYNEMYFNLCVPYAKVYKKGAVYLPKVEN